MLSHEPCLVGQKTANANQWFSIRCIYLRREMDHQPTRIPILSYFSPIRFLFFFFSEFPWSSWDKAGNIDISITNTKGYTVPRDGPRSEKREILRGLVVHFLAHGNYDSGAVALSAVMMWRNDVADSGLFFSRSRTATMMLLVPYAVSSSRSVLDLARRMDSSSDSTIADMLHLRASARVLML